MYDDEAEVNVMKGNKFAIESYGHEKRYTGKEGFYIIIAVTAMIHNKQEICCVFLIKPEK